MFFDKLDSDTFTLTYQTIKKYQRKKTIWWKNKIANHHAKCFCGGVNTRTLTCKNDKIDVPKIP